MLNEEKVKNMAKAAEYEEGPEGYNLKITEYFRTDYIGLQLVKSGVAYTVAFLILTAMVAFGKIEELMLMLSRAEELPVLVRNLLLIFFPGMILYEVCVYLYYSRKYQNAKQSIGNYQNYLKKIQKYYEQETVEDDYEEINLTDEETDL